MEVLAKRGIGLDLEVEAGALDGVGTDLAVGDGDVIGMNGVAFEGLGALEGAVEHHVGIRGCQTAVDVNLHVEESGNFAEESFQTFFNTCLDGLLLLFGEFWIQSPENDVLNHNLICFRVVSVTKISIIFRIHKVFPN